MMESFVGRGVGSFALLVFQLALPVHAVQSAPSVKWHTGLKLGDARASSMAGWRDALLQPWHLGNDPVSFSVSNGSNHVVVDRCDKLVPAVASGMRADGLDQAVFEAWAVRCEAVRLLINGVAPQMDFIGDFFLNEKGVGALPIGMAFVVSPDDEQKFASIKSRGGTLGNFLGNVTLQAVGDPGQYQVMLRNNNNGASQLLSVLAEGDFDHDGINDLLISSSNAMRDGSYRAAHLYIVSRLEADGPLIPRRKNL